MAFVIQGLDFLKFRSGTHGLNEELGRGREGKVESSICGAECESVVHVLWECPAYTYICSSCKEAFKAKVKELIGDSLDLVTYM